MYKVAILGCENSHAKSFLSLIQKGLYPEIEVVGVYSEESEAAEALHREFGVSVLADYAQVVGQVDGVMITARHGDNHYKYAKPYLNDGIPMFIDKPITCTEEDAVAFMREAKAKGVRLCGGSTCAALAETELLAREVRENTLGDLRGGSIACPLYRNSPYGGFFFYAQHLVEVMMTVFGSDVKAVSAEVLEKTITFTAHYEGYNVLATYLEGTGYYSVSVYGSKKAHSELLNFTSESFKHEMNDMQDLLCGKDMKKSYEEFIGPVFVMNAIARSLESGKRESVSEIVL